MTDNHTIQGEPNGLGVVYEYHTRTKHQFHQYARSLGYMDWDNQPDPFRRYDQALTVALDRPSSTELPTYDSLFDVIKRPAASLDRDSISRLFYESLAISAWKKANGNHWSLRVNPSSGDLHPTEAYLLTGPIEDLHEGAALYHYSAYQHALERRLVLTREAWDVVSSDLPKDAFLLALTSIYWRESWKYGERAFRYCHHDVGHAIGTIALASAALGWTTKLIDSVSYDDLETLLGLHLQEGVEAEHPDCLLGIFPADQCVSGKGPQPNLPRSLLEGIRAAQFEGNPNTLSDHHHDWLIIDAVAKACRSASRQLSGTNQDPYIEFPNINEINKDRQLSARTIIRQRRSATAMDGHTSISKEAFYQMMAHVVPHPSNNITQVLAWQPRISLALFIHRVENLDPGLYLLVRNPGHEQSLRKTLREDFRWEKPEGCPESLGLYLLDITDTRDTARIICCHQNIAADGAFAVAMMAEFDAALKHYGSWFYPRLFWETGLIGQILYLEAEAAGIRSTGIGCFFDDAMHEVLGIHNHTWQSLYHFTVGGPVEDSRLQTLPSYWHLKSNFE